MNIEQLPTVTLTPYARNARTHGPEQIAQIAASIQEFGFTNPILIDATNEIIAGHGRVMAAQKLGIETLPCIRLSHLSETQKRAYIIADNKIALNSGWDEALLAQELKELQDVSFDFDLFGFDDNELLGLLEYQAQQNDEFTVDPDDEPNEPDAADDVPDAPVEPVSRTGDVWVIGAHRLICGDATDPTVVATLMQGDTARLCFTSPPYGNQRDYTSGGIADWDGLMRGVFGHLPMASDGQVLVNLGLIHRDNEIIPYWDAWLGWMRTQGWRRFAWYVWDQGPGMPGDWAGRFAPSFEFVFHFNRNSRKPNKIVPCKNAGKVLHPGLSVKCMRGKDGELKTWQHKNQETQESRIPDSVIRVTRQCGTIGQGIDHPAVFPVALPKFLINAYTKSGDIVFEPFGGSGTTMLAAERTGRICRTVEIAPEYVDVAIKRFQQNHPGVPVALLTTGQSFDEVANERLSSTGSGQ